MIPLRNHEFNHGVMKGFYQYFKIYSKDPIYQNEKLMNRAVLQSSYDVPEFLRHLIIRYRPKFHYQIYDIYTDALLLRLLYPQLVELNKDVNVINAELYPLSRVDDLALRHTRDADDRRKYRFINNIHQMYASNDPTWSITALSNIVKNSFFEALETNFGSQDRCEAYAIEDVSQQFKKQLEILGE